MLGMSPHLESIIEGNDWEKAVVYLQIQFLLCFVHLSEAFWHNCKVMCCKLKNLILREQMAT